MYSVYAYIHIFWREGDNMKFVKDMTLMGIGAGAVLAYQKYSKPVKKSVEKAVDATMKKANKKLENMM